MYIVWIEYLYGIFNKKRVGKSPPTLIIEQAKYGLAPPGLPLARNCGLIGFTILELLPPFRQLLINQFIYFVPVHSWDFVWKYEVLPFSCYVSAYLRPVE
jgi:hypothetical protein